MIRWSQTSRLSIKISLSLSLSLLLLHDTQVKCAPYAWTVLCTPPRESVLWECRLVAHQAGRFWQTPWYNL